MFIPLGIKTDYSLLKSLIKIEDLVLYAKNNGINTLGILDDNLCSSNIFYKRCIENNIKPIIGLDIEIDNYRLFLYPQNYQGLKELFKLINYKNNNILSIENLKNYKDNIICVLPSESYNLFNTINNIFEIVYLSVKNNDEFINAKLLTNNIVNIYDIYALTKESSKYINYLTLIETNKKLGSIELVDYSSNIIIKNDFDNSGFTSLIDLKIENNNKYIPHFSDEIENSEEYLRNLSIKGLNRRLGNNVSDIYLKRLNYELDVIAKMGYTDYFLIVYDYVKFAIKNNIYVGVGRGSAAGSLVAYSLGITWIDPIKYDLLFERFLNPDRVTMPDIDIDFDYERREEVVSYIKERYGNNRVAKIITYGTMTAKEVLRSVAKINNVEDKIIDAFLKNIDSKKTLKENYPQVSDNLKRNSILNKVYNEAYYLEGIKKHIGIHAAGVVISSCKLEEVVPVVKSGEEYLTGYPMNELEELGLLKMDLLSIKNLTIIANILNEIRITDKTFNINNIPLDDKLTYELLQSGDTVGVFQFESNGMKNFLKKLKPTCFDDLVMALAMFRPGPMDNLDLYIDRKNKRVKVEYISDTLKPILESTYGILIYQEQIMQILSVMASYTFAEADIIRRAISKKKLEVIESERERFISNSVNNGYNLEDAKKIFDMIVKFADFGFNKSHSVAYAMIAYQMAYLKAHYKDLYYVNLLNTNIGGEAKTKEYISEAKQNGIIILKPDVNKSSYNYVVEENGIRLPLRVIKGIGGISADTIIKEREKGEFVDYYDFIARTYGFNVNTKILELLIYSGSLDSFGYNRHTLEKNIKIITNYAELIRDLDSSLVNKPVIEEIDELNDIELMQKEILLFGYYVSTHPANKYSNVMKLVNIKNYFDKYIETVVLFENIKTLKTKNNEDMAFILASDETASADFVVFSNTYKELKEIRNGDLVRIKGHVERRLDKYQIIVNKIIKI